nr:MAG TPA: minor structural protein [Caudoviricetes sp.]
MKRAELEALGLTKEQIDSVMGINGRDVEAAKGELAAVVAERDGLKKDIAARDTQIEDLRKAADGNEALQKQIAELQAENQSTKVNAAVESALVRAKARSVVAVKALLKGIDTAEISDDGTIKGLEDQIAALKSDENTKFLFDVQTQKKPSFKGVTPAEPSDPKPQGITREQFSKMGYKERLKLFNEDRETYDALTGGGED